ncbi:sugar isomerase [Fulvivirga sp. M361]|uniref:TIM barrel protein n=1 Tax=Fulvivirga sp. M361 TaxID=2594266 RepID=UPI00117AE9D7|nr:TIM barrel protein [Fulvivirga sp. M361]TRX60003.1 sugar isomerase [Fulvivirga sp. M361]
MQIDLNQIETLNKPYLQQHKADFSHLTTKLVNTDIDVTAVINTLKKYQVAIPSWALGTGGTRFGRFPDGGEPRDLEEKIADVGLLHRLNGSCGAISLHIPWDIPADAAAIRQLAADHDLLFDAVNSNTFQDQEDQKESYKFGSLSHISEEVRARAIEHNKQVIDYGISLGSKALTVWLADGSSFPGQSHFKTAFQNTLRSLQEIYDHLPEDWKVLIEYKPYEPNFYSMVIPDWGTSFLLANKLGHKAFSLVDLGHHLPNTNIEQIVTTLMMEGKLGGFHFNDSKYGDDDLTVGSLHPYQLFLIFNELVDGMAHNDANNPIPAWMIDASHTIKDPLEDLLQSTDAILNAYARALIIDRKKLFIAQQENDVAGAQEVIQDAFRTDVRPLVREARRQSHAFIDPLNAFRQLDVRAALIRKRGAVAISTGL